MDAQHTPGPLFVRPAQNGSGDFGIVTADHFVIAEAFADIRWDGERSEKEAEANARLFAASPELLAALLPCVEYDGGQCLGDYPEKLERACAAIAKATGKAPC